MERRRSARRRSTRSGRSILRLPSSGRWPSTAPRSTRSPANTAEPGFDNTVAALERSGRLLARVSNVFYVLAGAHTNEAIQAIERDMAPMLARHWNEIHLNDKLFAPARRRSQARREPRPDGRAGARAGALPRDVPPRRRRARAGAKQRLKEIGERLASLGTAFGQNVLADEQSYVMPLGEDDLAGLPDFARAAARGAAEERGLKGQHAVTLSRSSVEPFLQFSARRELREKAFRAWIARGDNGGKTDNKPVIAETDRAARRARAPARLPELRALQARRHHGEDAGGRDRPARCRVGAGAPPRRRRSATPCRSMVAAEGGNFALAPWDWRYYAEKLRKARYDLDESEIKPYLPLDSIIEAAFYTANRLFGLTFQPRNDVPVYHPDVRVWEVLAPTGATSALFFGDYFARPSKRSGAWMTSAARPGKARRRDPAARAQRDELQQGRGRRADAALASTTRARCSTSSAMACTA